MKCSDARRKLSALLDGADEASLRDVVARHVDGCVPCRAELDALAGVDRLVASGLRVAVQSTPPHNYHEDFWPRLSARLDEESQEGDAMSMSTSSEDRSQGQKSAASPGGGGGGEKPERQEVSGLHDIRALAASTIQRHSKEVSVGEVADALMASASPATLGQVVLPAPGKEVATVASSKIALSDAPPAQSSGWGKSLAVGAVMLAAGFGIAFVVFRGPMAKKERAADETTLATAATGSETAAGAPMPSPSDPSLVAASVTENPAGPTVTTSPSADTAGAATDPAKPAEVAMVDTKPAPRDAKSVDKSKGADRDDRAAPDRSKPDAKPDKPDTAAKADETKTEETAGGAGGTTATPKEEPKKNPSIEDLFNAPAADTKPAETKPVEVKPADEGPTELTNDEVKKGMGSIKARVQDCYAKFKVAGTVTVSATIEPDGVVTKAVAVDEKFANTDTGFCVAEAVSHAIFKKWNGPARTVRYPFRLQ